MGGGSSSQTKCYINLSNNKYRLKTRPSYQGQSNESVATSDLRELDVSEVLVVVSTRKPTELGVYIVVTAQDPRKIEALNSPSWLEDMGAENRKQPKLV